jgi:hypothetical protein
MIIGIDFDGTCVTHEFPKVGSDIGAIPVLKELVKNGHQLMLWTMRSDNQSSFPNVLQDAIKWFKDNEIPLFGVNENPEQIRSKWSLSNKQYAHLYIDDAALGIPLIHDELSERPYVDWIKVRELLVKYKLLASI